MRRSKYIIVRKPLHKKESDYSSEGFSKYIKANGHHFTEALSEFASAQLINSDGTQHNWSVSQVKKSIIGLGLFIPDNVTDGDLAYAANMYYSDFYPDPLSEAECLRAAYKIANDPDGYEGMIFNRWLADVKRKNINIDWTKFI